MSEEVKKVPQLRFPSFNNLWKTKNFEELFEFRRTNSFSRDQLTNISGSIRNIHYGDIHTKFGMILDVNKSELPKIIDSLNKNITDNNFCTDGDLVIADASEDYEGVGKSIELINVGDSKIISGLHTILVRQKYDDFIRGFMGYLMNSDVIHNQVKFYAVGTKVYSISKLNLCKLVVNYPLKDEQTKIANLLSTIDQSIENLEEKIRLLELQKKGVMQKMFCQELRFKRDDGGEFESWEKFKIGEIFEITRGKVIARDKVKQWPTNVYVYPVYSSQTTNEGIFGYLDTYMFSGNYLTWTTDGANAGKVFRRSGKFNCTNVCGLLIEKPTTIGYANNAIAEILELETPHYVSYVGNPKLMNNVISEIPVFIPKLAELNKISKILSIMDDNLNENKLILKHKKNLKNGLLQKMFI